MATQPIALQLFSPCIASYNNTGAKHQLSTLFPDIYNFFRWSL